MGAASGMIKFLIERTREKGLVMKELIGLFIKVSALTGGFIHEVLSPKVLSKRSLIHSDSFQTKI
jgi:hypothetical protein